MSVNNLLVLFDRPCEPAFIPKGRRKIQFQVPSEYMPDVYNKISDRIQNRFRNSADSVVQIRPIAIPNLGEATRLGRHDTFSLFIPWHRRAAARLIEIMTGMRSQNDLLSLAVYCRDRLNPQLFIYALSVTVLHRNDTQDMQVPALSEVFPDKFVDGQILLRANEQVNVVSNDAAVRVEIPRNWTATDADPEHRIAYWREDIGVNLHHWHWHLVYPFDGPDVIVNKDRRGELFYYFHHQMMARYNVERLAHNMARVKPLNNLRDPIPEAYFPKLDSNVAGRSWPSRPKGLYISDIDRPADNLRFTVSDLERFRDRILEAIHTRRVRMADGSFQPLTDFEGIDVIGNIIEASILTPNAAYYGDMHNLGHVALAYVHDPDHRHLESFGVMGDNTTAMRDPVFYRWHAFVDMLFDEFKNSVRQYTQAELGFPGIIVRDIGVLTPGSNPNTFQTHWNKSDIDLSRGLDFSPRSTVSATVTHLNHDAFNYLIHVDNNSGQVRLGTVRIFMAPIFDETGRRFSFNDQRLLMVEMDKFEHTFTRGSNTITRSSIYSTLTIPFEATFRDLNANRPGADQLQALERFNFCGCGWPQHMLVPRGNQAGFPMTMFVMVSNSELDRLPASNDPNDCRTGIAFCGLRDSKYPDRRSMNFPFDRPARAATLSNFLLSNMRTTDVTVRFSDVIRARPETPNAAFKNTNMKG